MFLLSIAAFIQRFLMSPQRFRSISTLFPTALHALSGCNLERFGREAVWATQNPRRLQVESQLDVDNNTFKALHSRFR